MADGIFLTDYEGRPLEVGSRVRYFDGFVHNLPLMGIVTAISDFDGDVDDDTGRSITIPPDVTVRWDDGLSETFTTSEWTFEYHGYDHEGCPMFVNASGMVEELDVWRDYSNERGDRYVTKPHFVSIPLAR